MHRLKKVIGQIFVVASLPMLFGLCFLCSGVHAEHAIIGHRVVTAYGIFLPGYDDSYPLPEETFSIVRAEQISAEDFPDFTIKKSEGHYVLHRPEIRKHFFTWRHSYRISPWM